jgi:hypothetical protein
VTFLQLLAKNGKRLKCCSEKQRIRDYASGKTSSRNSTDAWNSQLSQTPAFSAQTFDIPFCSHGHFPKTFRSSAVSLLKHGAVAV